MRLQLLSFLLLFSAYTNFSYGQAGSVELLDGTGTFISAHASIAAAYGTIPPTLTQAYIIEVKTTYTGASEFYPIVFFNKIGASSVNTITLRPEAAAVNIAISGNSPGSAILLFDNADFVIVDGSPGSAGASQALTFENQSVTGTVSAFLFTNGSNDNIIRFCEITGEGYGAFISSSATGLGNNNLTFEHCTFIDLPQCMLSQGSSVASKNDGLVVFDCDFIDFQFLGAAFATNTGNVSVDSSRFYNTTNVIAAGAVTYPIAFQDQIDTAVVTRNKIYGQYFGSSTAFNTGIAFISTSFGSAYSYVANNTIILDSNVSADEVSGIEFGRVGSLAPLTADLFHNSVLIGGSATGGTAGNPNSAAFRIIATHASSNINFLNNIFINERGGGNEYHPALSIQTTNGNLTGNYNTYSAADTVFAVIGSTDHPNFASYLAAVSPTEANSNTEPVVFTAANDLHLDNSMIGSFNIYGTNLASVVIDIDADARVTPFRGADELVLPPCTGTPVAGSVVPVLDTVCAGDSILVYLENQTAASGIQYQWQSRHIGGSFMNMPGDTTLGIWANIDSVTEVRCFMTCTASGLSDTSSIGTIDIYAAPSVDTIAFTNTLNSYTLNGVNIQYGDTFYWDFGDENDTISNDTISHVYNQPGEYTVTFVVFNQCGVSDSVTTTLTVDCFAAPAVGVTHVSDNTICLGESVDLWITGFDPVNYPFYSFQWQKSENSAPYVDITGATNDSLSASPTINTRFRCTVSCGGAGLSTNTVFSPVFVQTAALDSIVVTKTTPSTFTFQLAGAVGISTYQWDFGDGSTPSTLASPTHTYSAPGNYTVTFNGFGTCADIERTITVFVECTEPPIADAIDVTISGSSVSVNAPTTSTNVNYNWDFGDGSLSSDSSASNDYPDGGTYDITLVVSNACGSDTVTAQVSVVGIRETSSGLFNLYPNPTSDLTVINLNQPILNGTVMIRDVRGQLIYSKSQVAGSVISISAKELQLPAGTYFIEINAIEINQISTWLVR